MPTGRTLNITQPGRTIELQVGGTVKTVSAPSKTVEVSSVGSVLINTSAGVAQVHTQTAPSASWVISHTLARLPSVTIYLLSGELVEADVFATTSSVNIVLPAATSGRAILT